MTARMPRIERAWRREGVAGHALWFVLAPLSAVFSLAVRLRARTYRLRLRRRRRLPAAVVSVGNLSVGGTGETPTALWVAERLEGRGYRVAILSRGYGGTARSVTVAGPPRAAAPRAPASAEAAVVGDEALLLARRFAGPVIVARRRAEAGALACSEFGAEVLVLDDGFQHLHVHRDFDLVCLRAFARGDDCVLPAGRLREPLTALRRAHAVLVTKGGSIEPVASALEAHFNSIPVYHGQLRATCLVTPDPAGWRELPMGILAERHALGVAGLADPESFYRTLHEWDARGEDFLELPDHHVYTLQDWKTIAQRSRELDLVVTTEKDLVKLERFPFAKDKLVGVRVSMEIADGARLLDSMVDAIESRRAELAGGREADPP